MAPPPVVVRYEPDKDAAFGHALRPTRLLGAWRAVQTFLQGCADVQGPSQISLTVYRATQWDDAQVNERCLKAASAQFGTPSSTVGGGASFPSGELLPGGYVAWEGTPQRLTQFLDFLFAGDPWPKTTVGPVAVSVTYSFLWRDPDSLAPLPEQLQAHLTPDRALRSHLTVSLERRSFVQPRLWFPFAPEDPRLRDLVHLIRASLPFKLSSRHFRMAVPSKTGERYTFRRFDAEPLLAA